MKNSRKKRKNLIATRESILAFLKNSVVHRQGGYIVDLELLVEYIKQTKLNVSDQEFFRTIDQQGYKRGLAPFDQMYVGVDFKWRSKDALARIQSTSSRENE